MKLSSLIIPAALALVLLAACEEESRPRIRNNTAAQSGSNNFGYQPPTPGTATDFVTEATPTPTPEASPTPDAASMAPTPAPSPATEQRQVPYGTPVAGKPGFVTSPYAPYAGYVDVRGFPPNTEVKDPYSGKIFLVP
jgi:hypothetical protein